MIIIDQIPFCHTDGIFGLILGLFQFLPLLINVTSLWWGWKGKELIFILYWFFFKILWFSVLILQVMFEDPLQRPECIFDPFNLLPRFGSPAMESTQAIGLVAFMISYNIFFRRGLTAIQVYNILLLFLVPIALMTTGTYFPHQILIGCLYGCILGIVYMAWVKLVFVFYFKRHIDFYSKKRKYIKKDFLINISIGYRTKMLYIKE